MSFLVKLGINFELLHIGYHLKCLALFLKDAKETFNNDVGQVI